MSTNKVKESILIVSPGSNPVALPAHDQDKEPDLLEELDHVRVNDHVVPL
jgi:hypothetical protein